MNHDEEIRGGKEWKRFLFTREEAIKEENTLTLVWWNGRNGRNSDLETLVKPQQR